MGQITGFVVVIVGCEVLRVDRLKGCVSQPRVGADVEKIDL